MISVEPDYYEASEDGMGLRQGLDESSNHLVIYTIVRPTNQAAEIT
jgi:hypothetical protein